MTTCLSRIITMYINTTCEEDRMWLANIRVHGMSVENSGGEGIQENDKETTPDSVHNETEGAEW